MLFRSTRARRVAHQFVRRYFEGVVRFVREFFIAILVYFISSLQHIDTGLHSVDARTARAFLEFDKVLFLGIRTLSANDHEVFIGDIVALGEVDAFDEVMIGFGELDSIGIGVVHLLAGGFDRGCNPLKEFFVSSCIGVVELQDLIDELPQEVVVCVLTQRNCH